MLGHPTSISILFSFFSIEFILTVSESPLNFTDVFEQALAWTFLCDPGLDSCWSNAIVQLEGGFYSQCSYTAALHCHITTLKLTAIFCYPKYINWSRGTSGIGSWTPRFLHIEYNTLLGSIIHYYDDTQLYFLFQPDDPTVAVHISDCLVDIIVWMKEHHLQVNLVKTEFFNFPPTPILQHNFTIQLGSSTIISTRPATNLGAIFDNQLIFKDHTESTVILVWITQHQGDQTLSAQLLIQTLVISGLDYCNTLLAGLPSCSIKPLHMIQKAAAWLVSNVPKSALITHLLISLQLILNLRHWCFHSEQQV